MSALSRPATLPSAGAQRQEKPWAVGGLVAFATLLVLVALRGEFPVHEDTTRDLLRAVACANGNAETCSQGAPASKLSLYQGALWTRFLTWMHLNGITPIQAHFLVLALISIGAGVVAIAAFRHGGRAPSLLAGALFAFFALPIIEYPSFWNPSLLPLPIALFSCALLEHGRNGQLASALVSAVMLAVCADLHVMCGVFALLLLATTILGAHRPAVAAPLVAIVFGLSLFILSPLVWKGNFHVLVSASWAAAAGFALPLFLFFTTLLRPRWLSLTQDTRACALLLTLTAWAFVPLLAGAWDAPRYLLPVLPALSIGLAWLAALSIARVPTPAMRSQALRSRALMRLSFTLCVGLLACRFVVARADHWISTRTSVWTLSDIVHLSAALQARGLNSPKVFSRIQGLTQDALATLVALGDWTEGPSEEKLLVVKARRAALPQAIPDEWQVVELPNRQVAILRPLNFFLQLHTMRVCYFPDDFFLGCSEPLTSVDPSELDYPIFFNEFTLHSYSRLSRASTFQVELRLSVDTGVEELTRIIELLDRKDEWLISSIEGIGFEGSLPSRRVVIHGGTGQGTITLRLRKPTTYSEWRYPPPPLVETLVDERDLQRLLVPWTPLNELPDRLLTILRRDATLASVYGARFDVPLRKHDFSLKNVENRERREAPGRKSRPSSLANEDASRRASSYAYAP